MACREPLKTGGVPVKSSKNQAIYKDPAHSSKGSQDKTFESLFYESFDGGAVNGDGTARERILTIETLEHTLRSSIHAG